MEQNLAIKIKGLHKAYKGKKGEKIALESIDLEIPRGSFFGLLGPNGAGKSTMINIMAGLVNKTSGLVEICGHNIDTHPKASRMSIGIVPQELVLDPFFPAYEVLENTAGFYGVPKNKRRTMEIIRAVGLEDKAYAEARSLSGGMRRRLLVAKALVHNPDVVILDEPTAGVDVELRAQLWKYIAKINKQGTTILLTTHYLEEAEELCDQIAVIDDGRIIANDSKKNIMKTIDRKIVTIEFDQVVKELPKSFGKLRAHINNDDNIEVEFRKGKESFNEILVAINKSKLSVCDISTEEADLEEVFRHLTKAAYTN